MKMFDLKRFRRDKKISQKDLAELFGCNQNFISRIENGIRTLPEAKLDILQSEYGDISMWFTEAGNAPIQVNATPEEFLMAGAEAFAKQLVQMMNDKQIAPYGLLADKEKEIEKLNRQIGRLEAQLEVAKKGNAQEGGNAICADAG